MGFEKEANVKTPDLSISNCGGLFYVSFETRRGRAWAKNHVQPVAPWQGSPTGFYAERPYAWDIAQGAIDDGLVVE